MIDPLRHFAETWLAYRDGNPLSVIQTSWQAVCEAESAMREALEAGDPNPLEGRILRLEEENTRLREQVEELTRETQELAETRRLAPAAALMDVTRTVAYINAATHAPTDAVHAYRAGMAYAAQLIARQMQPR